MQTVLATLVAKHFREQEASPVILVPVKNYLLNGGYPSAKHLLDSIHDQASSQVQDKNTAATKHLASNSPGEGQLRSKNFIIIDDFDLLEKTVQDEIQVELKLLQERKFSVLITRAVPVFEQPTMTCNSCDRCGSVGEDDEGLIIYWECRDCAEDLENPTLYYLCETCNDENSTCIHTGHVMREPYDYVNVDVRTSIPGLRSFAQQDLEREFGAGLNPDHLDFMIRRSKMNINILKLRLDHVRELGLLEDTAIITDRLPRGIVAFFDTEVRQLGTGNANKRCYALLALAASSEKETITFDELEYLLRNSGLLTIETTEELYPHVQQAFELTRGLLCHAINTDPFEGPDSERYRVFPYHRDFLSYIHDDYNTDLVLAKEHLRQIRARTTALVGTLKPENHLPPPAETSSKYDALNSYTLRSIDESRENTASNLHQPNSVCASCRQIFFRGKQTSGVITLHEISSSSMCLFCAFLRENLIAPGESNLNQKVTSLHWSIRTMGRISNNSVSLCLAFRSDPRVGAVLMKRFVLLSKPEAEYKSSRVNLGRNTNLLNCGVQIRSWLQECDQQHTHCTSTRSPLYVPKRLVDIDTGIVDVYRIVHAQKQGINAPYLTLSHSWGRAKFLELVPQNEERLTTQGFSKLDLKNKNFVEAIELARFIGIKYIWIDSLCICQGANGDFKEEGQYMHQVYQNSFCNIVAADSIDSTGGVFRERDFDSICIVEYGAGEEETLPEGTWEIIEEDLWATRLLKSPIYTRGWVFQGIMTFQSLSTSLTITRTYVIPSHPSFYAIASVLGLQYAQCM